MFFHNFYYFGEIVSQVTPSILKGIGEGANLKFVAKVGDWW